MLPALALLLAGPTSARAAGSGGRRATRGAVKSRQEDRPIAAASVGPGARFVPGRGLRIASADRRFTLAIGLRSAVRYSARFGDGLDPDHTLELRRLRLVFQGNAFTEHVRFYVQIALSPRELDLEGGVVHGSPILDTYVRFDRLRDLTLTVGQLKVPFSRERMISAVTPLLVDPSLASGEFNLDRDLGLTLHSDDLGGLGHLRYYAGVFMGEGRDPPHFGDPGLLYVARVDLLPFGRFDDYEASDLARSQRLRASLGAAYAYQDRAHRDRGDRGDPFADGATVDDHHFTADLALRRSGFSVDAAYHWRRALARSSPARLPRDGRGWMVQAALLLPRTGLEPALRYSGTRSLRGAAVPDLDELSVGLHYYFFGHDLKAQVEYSRSWRGAERWSDLVQVQLQLNL